MRIKFIVVLLIMGISQLLPAQEPEKNSPADSAKIYRELQKIAGKKTFSKWLFSLVFNIPEKIKKPPRRISKRIVPRKYSYYEGKTIRNITIETFDPFGYDIRDTSVKPEGFLRLTGNKIHVKTFPIAIKNLLLFRSGDQFDSLLVKESERLIRKQRYVHDVAVTSKVVKKDSVDLNIRVLDVWSLTPRGSLTPSAFSLGFTDQNFIGSGQQFDNLYSYSTVSHRGAYETNYVIPNIRHSYIGARIQYQINGDRSFLKVLDIERQFFSSFTKWGGGVYIGQRLTKDSIIFPDSSRFLQNFKYNTQDLWIGKSWRIFGGRSEFNRTTNFVISTRFQRINYLEKPVELYDSLHIFADERFVYFGLGISSRQYVQDRYIFKYGLVEDVPKGILYGITGGYQVKNSTGRWYLGFKASWGQYYRWGYMSTNLEYGRFLNKGSFEEGAVNLSINYFSDLVELGRWKIRQFVKPQVIFGIKRLPTDKITINDQYGITGFAAPDLNGIHKILLSLQTQSYAPWNLIGFRFGPYLVYSMGMLGSYNHGFRNTKLYSLLGLGVLIKNDFLVFNTFQLSLAFYPVIPGNGKNISKFNAYKTSDFGFREFDIEKPATVTYQ